MNTIKSQSKFYIPFIDSSTDLQINYIPTDWNSLFIPSLPGGLVDEELLTYIIEEIFILGEVKRIDIIKKENSNNRLMAFIHLNFWYKNNSTDTFRQKIENEGHADVYGFINNDNIETDYWEFITSLKEGLFIRFMINKTPIKDTELNIHQLADVLEKAEKRISEQDLLIEQMRTELEEAKMKIAILENQNLQNLENEWQEKINYIDFENINIPEVTDLDDYLFKKELENIEPPKLTRECYINRFPSYDEDNNLII